MTTNSETAQMAGELLPCPLCRSAPRRNGRGRTGGVVCGGNGDSPLHMVQTYGADQAEADTAWNTRATLPPTGGSGCVVVPREVLVTARDYVADASKGALTYENSGEGFIAMAKEDLGRIDAALSAAPQAAVNDGWRDIASAPKDGTWFLGYWPACTFEDRIATTQWHDFGMGEAYWLDGSDSRDWTEPTHWRPLLPAPTDGGAA